jgi:CheY-like chemotaxis protein
MSKRVLWLDNDEAYIQEYRAALEKEGMYAKAVTTVTEAEEAIRNDSKYDLLILDVMIPTKSEDEELDYPPEETNSGLKTGLVFYRRMKEQLKALGTKVIVMTVRLDKGIREEFKEAGLEEHYYFTKMTLRESPFFVEKIRGLLETTAEKA